MADRSPTSTKCHVSKTLNSFSYSTATESIGCHKEKISERDPLYSGKSVKAKITQPICFFMVSNVVLPVLGMSSHWVQLGSPTGVLKTIYCTFVQ